MLWILTPIGLWLIAIAIDGAIALYDGYANGWFR